MITLTMKILFQGYNIPLGYNKAYGDLCSANSKNFLSRTYHLDVNAEKYIDESTIRYTWNSERKEILGKIRKVVAITSTDGNTGENVVATNYFRR